MSFDAIARLLSGQRPFHLYQWTRGFTQWWFTNIRDDVITTGDDLFSRVDFFGESDMFQRTWAARKALSHGRIPDSSEIERTEFTVTLPLSDAFARQFLGQEGRDRTGLRIWKGFTNDPDGELVLRYAGDIIAARPDARARTIRLIHQADALEFAAAGLPEVIQQPCPYAIYDPGTCRLPIVPNQVDGTVSALTTDGLTLTIAAASSAANGFYRAGVIEYAGAQEAITRHQGDQIEIEAPLPGLAAAFAVSGSEPVKIAPGCRQNLTRCASLGNSDNFGGFPWLSDDPFDGRNIV